MNYALITDIARSLVLARWRQTLVAAIGVTFGIMAFVALLSFMNGLNDLLDGLIINRTPHVHLFNEIRPNPHQPVNQWPAFRGAYNFIRSVKPSEGRLEIYNSGPVMEAISQDKRVLGLSPKITAQVFYNSGSIDLTGMINGIDPEAENRLFFFGEYVVAGRPADLNNVTGSIILGKGVAQKLLVGPGDRIQVTSSTGERTTLRVVGIFQSGIGDFDKVQSYTSVATAQKVLGKPSSYLTDIQVKLRDIREAPAVARQYRQLFRVDAEDIQTANAQYETGSSVRTIISYAVGITLLIVAGFGIYNILNMMIYEKMDTIAILKATGFSGGDVKGIFLSIALGIGLFGGLLGLLLGYLLSVVIHHIPFVTPALPTVRTFPVAYRPIFYLIGIGFSLITTSLAGWFPARKASRVDPVVIIRGK
ncbi:MAG TPA: ABC transporter permease [Chitinophagaceae bacterium]|nr:ABC transporter permease [Chitinophagaceae bacterium]